MCKIKIIKKKLRRQEWQSYIKVLQTSHRDREGRAAGCEEI